MQKMKFFERLQTLNKSLIFGGYTLGKIKENICLKIKQNPCTKHHQIDQKTSIFHTFQEIANFDLFFISIPWELYYLKSLQKIDFFLHEIFLFRLKLNIKKVNNAYISAKNSNLKGFLSKSIGTEIFTFLCFPCI